ncbi:MAG: heme-binding protein [Synechococcus sp. BS307-5m-G37]|nr:heme-binding protein [Synechococcus sp. BS307-5m-G37]
MQMIPCLDLADAEAIVSSALQAAERSASQVSIAVVDGAGLLIRFSRIDGASAASVEAAMAKARTAALTGNDSASAEQAIASGRLALLSLQGVLHQPCALMAGGLVLRSQGVVVGAIGVSGMTPDQDTAIARAGADCFELRVQGCSS